MTTATIADPFAAPHEAIAEQLEPFCDGDLERFTAHELLNAYDLATAWSDELALAAAAAAHIAAEWLGRYDRNLPPFGSDLASTQFADLAAQYDRAFAALDAKN